MSRRPDRSRPRVTVVSPHFDDAPLSLGQSMTDGVLDSCSIRVEVVFGRTNWTRWVHPTRGRARAVGLWRRAEEGAAALRFGYRYRTHPWEELILRTGELDPDVFRSSAGDPQDELLTEAMVPVFRRLRGMSDMVVFPAGLGAHVDHRLVAAAGVRLAQQHADGIGFYEDRPYVSFLDAEEKAEQLGALGLDLESVEVSGPVSEQLHRRLRRCYPSQISGTFMDAMAQDRAVAARERLWVPAGEVPSWLRPGALG